MTNGESQLLHYSTTGRRTRARWCFAERNRSAGRSGTRKNPATHTHTRARRHDLMHSTKRAAAQVVTPSISAANFVHVLLRRLDVHDNDDNYTQNYTHTRPTTACSRLSKTIIILIYKFRVNIIYNYMIHGVVLPRRKSKG